MMTTAFLCFLAWSLAVLAFGIVVGRCIHEADVREGTAYDDGPSDDDTREILLPRRWVL